MSGLPRIVIDLAKIARNVERLNARCRAAGVQMLGAVKGVAGDQRVIHAMVDAGLTEVGDSRLENLQRMTGLTGITRVMLRLPALSRIGELITVADLSLNTEESTLQAIDDRLPPGKRHQVMLMVDLGDLREGVEEEQIAPLGRFSLTLHRLKVTGLGANFSCFAGAIPTVVKLERLTTLATLLRDEYMLPITRISGGNSSSLPLLYGGTLPAGINHLRIGEGILLGKETLHGSVLPDLEPDAFTLEAEVIQAQWKPGQSDGPIGRDAFGRTPELPEVSSGMRLLLTIGHQDTPLNGLTPLDSDIRVLGGSSDYLVLASERRRAVGDVIRFRPDYWSLLALMTSPYIAKEYLP